MSSPNEPFIFVSYANKDAALVHTEIERLERQGYRVWYDEGELQPARFWAEEISEAITACTCFMVFITEDSVLSEHVCEEIEQALKENKPFIAVYWDNVELPAHLQTQVRKRQTLDRYSMHQVAYEGPLSQALSEHIPLPLTPKPMEVIPFPPIPPRPDILPKIVFFGLVAAAVSCLFLAVLLAITAPFISRTPEELAANYIMGFITGGIFVVISLGLGAGAFAVFRIYLRRTEND